MTTYTIEAEDMQLDGYQAKSNSSEASNGGYIQTWGDGSATTTFEGEAGTYGIDLSMFDENDGSSTVEVFINGQPVALTVLDQDEGGNYINGTLTNYSLLDVELNPGDVIEIRGSSADGEAARIDKLELTLVEPASIDPALIGENVVLLEESFNGSDSVESSDLHLGDGYAATNASWDGDLKFDTVSMEDKVNGKLTLDMAISQGGFEQWGEQYGDMLSIELIDQDGTVHVLDVFVGSGHTLVGSQSGQVLDGCDWDSFEYDIPEGVTSFQLLIQTDISANCEVILLDNVMVTANELLEPVEPVLTLDAVDDTITVLETEGAGDTDINVLENDTSDFGPVNQVLLVEGQSANVGEWIDLDGGGRVRIDENGDLDFDADGDFDALNTGESAIVDLEYTIAEMQVTEEEYQCLFFDEFAAGTVLTDQLSSAGVTISSANSSNPVMIFDTDNPTGGDSDLATSNLGKVLILSEDRDSNDPDDNAGGGTFIFDFDRPAELDSLTFLDTEEPGAEIRFYDAAGDLITTVQGPVTPDGGQATANFDVSGVARMEVELQGSGAIDNLVYTLPGSEEIVAEDTATVTIEIEGIDDPNSAPVANDNLNVTDEATAVSGNVILDDDGFGIDSDPDGDTLTVSALSFGNVGESVAVTSAGGREGQLVVLADGTYTFTPGADFAPLNPDETDTVEFSYTVSDGNGGTASANVTITINGLNLPPVAVNDSITIGELDQIGAEAGELDSGGQIVTLNILDNDSDPDAIDTIMLTGAGNAAPGEAFTATTDGGRAVQVTVAADGTVAFDTAGQFDELNTGESDAFTFNYSIADGNGGTSSADVTITIEGEGEPDTGGPANSINIVFVVDGSRSSTDANGAAAFFEGFDPADTDIDGDGLVASQLDAQLYTLQQISDAFAASGETDVELSFVLSGTEISGGTTAPTAFSSSAGQSTFAAGEDLSGVFGEIDQSGSSGVARIDLGLQAAQTTLTSLGANDADTTENYVFLMSDNSPALSSAGVPGLTGTVAGLQSTFGDTLAIDALIFDANMTSVPFFENFITNVVSDGSVDQIETQQGLSDYLTTLNEDLIA
ncbi:MAG: Ig-like domain-containing protein [Pseudomonadota bacterium]